MQKIPPAPGPVLARCSTEDEPVLPVWARGVRGGGELPWFAPGHKQHKLEELFQEAAGRVLTGGRATPSRGSLAARNGRLSPAIGRPAEATETNGSTKWVGRGDASALPGRPCLAWPGTLGLRISV
ncbi:hypothetical protein PCL_10146 [Purpureocillium lilacinum]|uniref:Uncharacterized protein n=1 Tax=Purpureocillium lilacinum TaxID=33203 RepID=A0A2U3EF34_PURLI|nr:hypothetical protein Purlil1_1293 [Purpureocillium lilacinum]PWI73131.1 hypothetical protein PCL_10146 [Purpureocillium lilacinum]